MKSEIEIFTPLKNDSERGDRERNREEEEQEEGKETHRCKTHTQREKTDRHKNRSGPVADCCWDACQTSALVVPRGNAKLGISGTCGTAITQETTQEKTQQPIACPHFVSPS
jgi:hypothetical protein